MANHDHWMRLNIGDFLADTMHLSTLQIGIYLALIMHYFKRGPLPADPRILARISRVSPRAWARDAPAILALFSREGDTLRHKRIDAERREAERLTSRKRAKRDAILARTPGTTATTNNPPPKPSPVVNLHSRRRKQADGGWSDVATDFSTEAENET